MISALALLLAAAALQPGEAAPPEARRALHEYAGCIVRHSRGQVAAALQRDFTTPAYRTALLALSRNGNEACFDRHDTLRANGLPFAGALAEHLLAADQAPLNARLVRAAARPAPRFFSPTDRMAQCVVRSVPDDVARLLATPVAGIEEEGALAALEVPIRACSSGGPRMAVAPAGLRAMVATAAFRLLAGGGEPIQGASAPGSGQGEERAI